MRQLTASLAVALHATALAAQAPAQLPARLPDSTRFATGQPIVLTRGAAIATALENNPQLAVARAQTAQASARRVGAIAVPDPGFTYSLDNRTRFLQLGNTGQRNAAIGMAVPFPDKFRLRNRAATSEVRAFQFSYAGLRQEIAAQTSREYDSLLVALRHREDFTAGRDLASDFLRKTRARFEGGTVPKLDVIRAQVTLAQAENDVIASARDVTLASDALDRLMGLPLGTPVLPADSLGVPPFLPDLDPLASAALELRPELKGLASQRAGARANTALAREFWLPDLVLSVQRDYGPGGIGALYSTGVALPLPVFYWQHARGQIAESGYRERELSASYLDLAAQVSQEVRAAYASASVAFRQAIYIRDVLLPAAREAYRVASVSYGLGGSSALEVLDARRSLLGAQTQYADALAAASSARADLERAVGAPLTDFPARSTP